MACPSGASEPGLESAFRRKEANGQNLVGGIEGLSGLDETCEEALVARNRVSVVIGHLVDRPDLLVSNNTEVPTWTAASSHTSRTIACAGDSSASMWPPGTVHPYAT